MLADKLCSRGGSPLGNCDGLCALLIHRHGAFALGRANTAVRHLPHQGNWRAWRGAHDPCELGIDVDSAAPRSEMVRPLPFPFPVANSGRNTGNSYRHLNGRLADIQPACLGLPTAKLDHFRTTASGQSNLTDDVGRHLVSPVLGRFAQDSSECAILRFG